MLKHHASSDHCGPKIPVCCAGMGKVQEWKKRATQREALGPSGWMMWSAPGRRQTSCSAPGGSGGSTTAAMRRMSDLSATQKTTATSAHLVRKLFAKVTVWILLWIQTQPKYRVPKESQNPSICQMGARKEQEGKNPYSSPEDHRSNQVLFRM